MMISVSFSVLDQWSNNIPYCSPSFWFAAHRNIMCFKLVNGDGKIVCRLNLSLCAEIVRLAVSVDCDPLHLLLLCPYVFYHTTSAQKPSVELVFLVNGSRPLRLQYKQNTSRTFLTSTKVITGVGTNCCHRIAFVLP